MTRRRSPDAAVVVDRQGNPIADPEAALRGLVTAAADVGLWWVSMAAGFCFWRWIAPFTSFNEWTAGFAIFGLPTVVGLAKKRFAQPLQKLGELIRLKGFDLDRVRSYWAMPKAKPLWLLIEAPLLAGLFLLYRDLNPVKLRVETGAIADLCAEPGGFSQQPFIGRGSNQSQGGGPPGSAENSCRAAFARCYEHVWIRTGPIGHDAADELQVTVDGAVFAYIVTAKAGPGVLKGATGKAVPAIDQATFVLPAEFSRSDRPLESYFALEGLPRSVRITAKLGKSSSKRAIDVDIPNTHCQ